MFFFTSDIVENLIARKMQISDNVIPSSNSTLATVLFKLGHLLSNDNYLQISTNMLAQVRNMVATGGPYYAQWAKLLGWLTHPPTEVAIVGTDALKKDRALQKYFLPNCLFMGGLQENLPLLAGKLKPNETLIYICRKKVCWEPVKGMNEALVLLASKE